MSEREKGEINFNSLQREAITDDGVDEGGRRRYDAAAADASTKTRNRRRSESSPAPLEGVATARPEVPKLEQ